MSVDDNKLLVRNFYEEIVNTGNVDQIEKYIAPSYVEVFERQKHALGIQGAKEHIIASEKGTFSTILTSYFVVTSANNQ